MMTKDAMAEIDVEALVEIHDEATLRAVVAHWQRILRLADFEIEAHLVSQCDLNGGDQVASCAVDLPRRAAQIYLLKPETRRERWRSGGGRRYYGLKPMEVDVVHELMHLWTEQCGLNDLDHGCREHIAMEQMTESLATVFVGLRSYFGKGGEA